ncbi:hypothetical protein H1D32_02485 [Anaerobacillus sp. CMMVII]|uniref:CBO0543 family protein n=1 Tax=Anaerobacillus sp. CMMVII TaxID=2755588 RepID=UPI0021B7945D|nr:CBO0543 family protein [Anaerobacillus sp. CMMVII]MCT8136717.1 hypothetical protein [Anaerobacillus sp. CMMVII]
MFLNILFGFIIPWIFGLKLYDKDKKSLLLIGPFASVVAFTFDVIGQAKFWRTKPIYKTKLVSSIPVHLGVYPISAGYLTYFLRKRNLNSVLVIAIFSFILTLFELVSVKLKRVRYQNGWNIYWTFVSYLIAGGLCYWYNKQLKKLQVF